MHGDVSIDNMVDIQIYMYIHMYIIYTHIYVYMVYVSVLNIFPSLLSPIGGFYFFVCACRTCHCQNACLAAFRFKLEFCSIQAALCSSCTFLVRLQALALESLADPRVFALLHRLLGLGVFGRPLCHGRSRQKCFGGDEGENAAW